jgi:hypothetical protein
MKMYVKTAANLRSLKKPEIILSVLPKGTEVEVLEVAAVPFMGYDFLTVLSSTKKGLMAKHLLLKKEPEKHLINDLMRPNFKEVADKNSLRARIAPIQRQNFSDYSDAVHFLEVEKNPVFAPKGSTTYCNVYAFQLLHQLGAYLPRIWWMSAPQAEPLYAKNVFELSANDLLTWLRAHAGDFGYSEVSLEELDSSLHIALVRNQRGSGHIAVLKNKLSSEAGRVNRASNPNWKKWFVNKKFAERAIYKVNHAKIF